MAPAMGSPMECAGPPTRSAGPPTGSAGWASRRKPRGCQGPRARAGRRRLVGVRAVSKWPQAARSQLGRGRDGLRRHGLCLPHVGQKSGRWRNGLRSGTVTQPRASSGRRGGARREDLANGEEGFTPVSKAHAEALLAAPVALIHSIPHPWSSLSREVSGQCSDARGMVPPQAMKSRGPPALIGSQGPPPPARQGGLATRRATYTQSGPRRCRCGRGGRGARERRTRRPLRGRR